MDVVLDANVLLGRCIRAARREAGWSQVGCADSLKMTRSGLSHVEAGRQAFTSHQIIRTERVLGRELDLEGGWLFRVLNRAWRRLEDEGVRVVVRPLEEGEQAPRGHLVDHCVGVALESVMRTTDEARDG